MSHIVIVMLFLALTGLFCGILIGIDIEHHRRPSTLIVRNENGQQVEMYDALDKAGVFVSKEQKEDIENIIRNNPGRRKIIEGFKGGGGK